MIMFMIHDELHPHHLLINRGEFRRTGTLAFYTDRSKTSSTNTTHTHMVNLFTRL